MAKYQGRTVTLNKPRRIAKGAVETAAANSYQVQLSRGKDDYFVSKCVESKSARLKLQKAISKLKHAEAVKLKAAITMKMKLDLKMKTSDQQLFKITIVVASKGNEGGNEEEDV